MDISPFVSALLLEHDCVVIPGFGGFVCNYRSSEIHPVKHTISPPAKAITFNKNLSQNDGLLMQAIVSAKNVTNDKANAIIADWVNTSKGFLRNGEEVVIARVGTLQLDIENNIQFSPDTHINYLKSSFGLRTITVPPIIRGKEIEFTEKFSQETKHQIPHRKPWRIAAAIALLVSLAVVGQMMYSGTQITALKLDEGGVLNFVNTVFSVEEPEIKPLPIDLPAGEENIEDEFTSEAAAQSESIEGNTVETPATEYTEAVVAEDKENAFSPVEEWPGREGYYVIIGAFIEPENVAAMKERLQARFPDSVIIIEKGKRLTKLGYSVGTDYQQAVEKLKLAKEQEDSTCWLLKK